MEPFMQPTAVTHAQNTGNFGWHNITAWTSDVSGFVPTVEDIFWAGPRFVMKYVFFSPLTETFHHQARQLSTATPASLESITDDPNIYNIIASALPTTSAATALGSDQSQAAHIPRLSLDGSRGLGSIFNYATSKWAISCIAMAVVLNRTHIFAATRRRFRFRFRLRFCLRILPIIILSIQAWHLLQSIQCQTSPNFARLRWGDANKSSDLMFAFANRALNSLTSTVLLGATDEQSCRAIKMTPTDEPSSTRQLQGSLTLLWPLFGSFCLSQFVETVSCAIQGRPVAAETGMTLFEQSLAFAEADAAVSNQLSWSKVLKTQSAAGTTLNSGLPVALTRSMILKRVNTPPEVLFVAFLSTMTHITSHVLAIFNLQARYRLINTGIWGLCFMGTIVWSAFAFEIDNPDAQGLLRFPTVCIIGFVPHVLVLLGIAICLFIYGLAILLCALTPPAGRWQSLSEFRRRIAEAHENMQANVSLSEIRITREMDFYTALLRAGFAAITMASEAVYLNEDRAVNVQPLTWLEESRFREAEEIQRQWNGVGANNLQHDQIGAIGLIPVKGTSQNSSNGYERERAAQKVPKNRGDQRLRVGIGAGERSSRWIMALDFVLNINKLLARVTALAILWALALFRIRSQPAWLLWLASRKKTSQAATVKPRNGRSSLRGLRNTPIDNYRGPTPFGIDIEAEFRRINPSGAEEDLDDDLYSYWLKGGWWGSHDTSGEYKPAIDDDSWDTTSVVSMSTTNDGNVDESNGWETDDDDGVRTPTQRSPRGTRDTTPVVDSPLALGDLARLLHPTNIEERQEAQKLAAHLQSDGVMTRSSFRRMEKLQRIRILTNSEMGSRYQRAGRSPGRPTKLAPEDEEQLLEQLLLSRRQECQAKQSRRDLLEDNPAGVTTEGESPHCVVCQCAPRTVIVWPCRCLSLCDDCRVSLAMNNFDKCVCCRRDVLSFSRIYVP